MLLFDYDGVIADSLHEAKRSFNLLAKKHDIQIEESEFQELYADNFFKGLNQKGISDDKIHSIAKELQECLSYDNVKVFPEIPKIIKELSERHTIIIISSNFSGLIRKHMEDNNIEGISKVLGADSDFSKTRKILSIEGKDKVYIGDTTGDIREGKKAGVMTVAAAWGFHPKELLAKENPDHILEKPSDLLKLF
ncbi:MAG: HAD-IA family hydrolase [Candidatus Woesearchaeota archaeon]